MTRVCKNAAAVVSAALLASACTPRIETHGYVPRQSQVAEITAGRDTIGSVKRKLGRPSTIGAFDDKSWYYISSKTETLAFYEPKIIEQNVVAVHFNDAGLVSSVNNYGLKDGRVIDLVTRKTPTYGRELTLLQQLLGNIGRFAGGPGKPAATPGSGGRRR